MTGGIAGLFKSYGIELVQGWGKLTSDKKVSVNDGERILDADKIIFAGGSSVVNLNLPGMDSPRVLTSDTILNLEEVPNRLVVVGVVSLVRKSVKPSHHLVLK